MTECVRCGAEMKRPVYGSDAVCFKCIAEMAHEYSDSEYGEWEREYEDSRRP